MMYTCTGKSQTLTDRHTHMHTGIKIEKHSHTNVQTHTCTEKHTHTHNKKTHKKNTHTHARTHTYIHYVVCIYDTAGLPLHIG